MRLIKKILFIGVLVAVCLVALLPVARVHACGLFSSCDQQNTDPNVTNNSALKESILTEQNQRKLDTNQPAPTLEKSNERANLIERLNRFNDPNKISYIYLVNFGKVMAFYTIKGKVSSVNSMLTTSQQLIDRWGNQCSSNGSTECWVINSPDLDGSYGSNGDAIFFFTTDNTYVEWHGDYMLVDQPLQLSTPPELVRQIGTK